MSVLVVDTCVKRYGRTLALDGVSLSVSEAETVGLVGPNGSGKTTLLHSIFGLVHLDSGAIRVDGQDVRRAAARAALAFMPDDLPRPRMLTPREIVRLSCSLYGRVFDEDRLFELATHLQLADKLDSSISGFSHGMLRKVDFISAVLLEPKILVLDEPFSGMDPNMVDEIRKILSDRSRKGMATLLSTHDLELAQDQCDRFVMLAEGRVVADGAPDSLIADAGVGDIRDAFRFYSAHQPSFDFERRS